jgi:hypothetical protein
VNDDEDLVTLVRRHGGWAATDQAVQHGLAWLPDTADGSWIHGPSAELEQPSCDVTWWTPPEPLSLDDDQCAGIIAATVDLEPHHRSDHPIWQAPWRCTAWSLTAEQFQALDGADTVLRAAAVANVSWWRLNTEGYMMMINRYRPGHRHPPHCDMHCGQMRRKLALSVQLSDSSDYRGGDLLVGRHGVTATAPRERGSVVAFPGWVTHEVTEITAGERWALIVWGYGPPVH